MGNNLSAFGRKRTAPNSPYGVLSLNALYAFAAVAGIMHLVEKRQAAVAILIWLVAGVLVDYAFMGVGLTLACWLKFRQTRLARAGVVLALLAALCLLNGNPWAFAAVLVIALAAAGHWRLERRPWAFYVVYPVHLMVLAVAAAL